MSSKILNESGNLLLAQTLDALINRDNKLSPAALARKLGIPTNKITRILNGDVTDPKASTLLQIASYFGITIEQLMGLESIIPQGQPRELISSQQVPIFEISNYGDQQAPKEWYRWSENTIDGDYYALSVDTDLYEPTFPLNSLLIINPDLKPEDRSFVVIRTKNKPSHCSIKKYVIDGDQTYLYPINPKLSVEIYDQTLYIISGVILEVHQKLRLKK